ncbi:MAG: chemotaxis response regulator protein-glutamate methylesterase [Bdellovibrionaceae bacterium]|nr:chemotaxis response regulator protein-glutamate methylesterase [Pseudobdellovibrionaceae bacterium]
MNKIKVLIVDDSLVIRKFLEKIFTLDSEIEIVGSVGDPYQARERIFDVKPDVMMLDVEMPRMDGITFLEKVMKHCPIKTIVFSSIASRGSQTYLRAIDVGAVEVIEKPAVDVAKNLESIGRNLIQAVKDVHHSRIFKKVIIPAAFKSVDKKNNLALSKTTNQILAIASSTGGTDALKVLFKNMPADIPGTVVVQHMPPGFTKTFADHLNALFPFEVKEAEDGDVVCPGRVLIAPGNFHMEIRRHGARYSVVLHQDQPLHNVRPAADCLMRSVAQYVGGNAIGVVLTGMGKDGATGLMEMKKAGSYNLAQNESTCVVYGMPAAAVQLGAIDKIVSLDLMAYEILAQLKKKNVA